MEIFGILLSGPFLCFASIIYALLVTEITKQWDFVSKPFIWISCVIILLFAIEVIAVISNGTIAVREAIGANFYTIHSTLFFLIVPSIVNVMRIQKKHKFISELYVIGPVCGLLGFAIVLFQYVVSESLFGVDGVGGPYS